MMPVKIVGKAALCSGIGTAIILLLATEIETGTALLAASGTSIATFIFAIGVRDYMKEKKESLKKGQIPDLLYKASALPKKILPEKAVVILEQSAMQPMRGEL